MNRKLKAKIVERFGSQSEFAQVLGVRDPYVSRVVNGRDRLSESGKSLWASVLNCEKADIFQEGASNE